MELRHRSTFQKKNISTRGALWGPCYKHDGDDCESDSKDPLGWLLSSYFPFKIAQTFGAATRKVFNSLIFILDLSSINLKWDLI